MMLMRSWLQVQSSDRPIILIFSNCLACTSTSSHCFKNCLARWWWGKCMSVGPHSWLQIHYCSWRSSSNFLTRWSWVKRPVALYSQRPTRNFQLSFQIQKYNLLFKRACWFSEVNSEKKEMTNSFHIRTKLPIIRSFSSNMQRQIGKLIEIPWWAQFLTHVPSAKNYNLEVPKVYFFSINIIPLVHNFWGNLLLVRYGTCLARHEKWVQHRHCL